MATKETILVTGGSGFIGSHCILQGLQKGYGVRTTIRSLKRAEEVKQMLRVGGASEEQVNSVEFVAADLLKDEGWKEACEGCTYVLHVASPFPPGTPKHEDDLINPAREGTLRALRAAKAAGTVKRVVVTSSFAAIGYGQPRIGKAFNEESWTDLENPSIPVTPYPKSKTLAERAAWDFIKTEGGQMDLAVVNPVAVLGPVLSEDSSTSVQIVQRMISGQLPACPQITFGCVDVRDVAELHLIAMTNPKAAGQRYLATADGDFVSILEIAQLLKDSDLPKSVLKRLPSLQLPNFILRGVALFDPTVRLILPELGKAKNGTNVKAKTELGWAPRSTKESAVSCAKSLLDLKIVKA